MARVVAQIPFLSKILDEKPIYEVVQEKLEDKGYKVTGVGYSVAEKTYSVKVEGSKDYYNKVNEEIRRTAEDIISSRGYDDFKVKVEKQRKSEPIVFVPANKDIEIAFDVLSEIVPKLQQQGYKIHPQYSSGNTNPNGKVIRLQLRIEDTEKRTKEIEKAILEGIKKRGIKKEVTIKFQSFNVKEKEIENKWAEVLPVIWEGMLSKKEYKTKGVGYSYKKGVMNIYITTKIRKSDSDAAELGKKIEKEINEFLQSEKIKETIGDNPYKIIVQDKKSKKIN
ncbi:DUF4030 domain-containing protein [Bacillus massilinigeriensis]|uniref:DUF4030 domain-containing protein n=1 Tax=Bacillus mediterraneensis TaxID=1805474 RepID=UPI0008F88A66|nr:DUF4030 domain-containing protein [Bacillus mediterraneensis]